MVNQLPRTQKVMILPHGLGWIPIITILWGLSPHLPAKQAFTALQSNSGWEPIGLLLMVGQIIAVYKL